MRDLINNTKEFLNNISDFNFIKYALAAVITIQLLTAFVLDSYTFKLFFFSSLALLFILLMYSNTEKKDEPRAKTIEDESENIEEE